jgi:surfactin synthase thioesterase subunit
VRALVRVPYGGASAVVYQPLADALPAGHRLFAVSLPGHDLGTADEEPSGSVEEIAARCVAEILDRIEGPLVIYGHCGPGGALAVEIARQVEAAGRRLEALYLGAIFPFSPHPRSARSAAQAAAAGPAAQRHGLHELAAVARRRRRGH